MQSVLAQAGYQVNHKRIRKLMHLIGIETIYAQFDTSKPAVGHPIYLYLLRGLSIDRVHQVWANDITYVPMQTGYMYLMAILDLYSRYVVPNTSEAIRRTDDKLKNRIKRLEDDYADGNLNIQEYRSLKNRFEESRNELIYQHGRLVGEEISFKKYVKYGFSLLHNLTTYYYQAPFEVKQKVIDLIFPGQLINSENLYRTSGINTFVSLICHQSGTVDLLHLTGH